MWQKITFLALTALRPSGSFFLANPCRLRTGRAARVRMSTEASAPPAAPRGRSVLGELREVFAEARKLAGDTGWRVSLTRSLQAGRALALTAADYIDEQEETTLEPSTRNARVLRRLFERLGGTYVKLGQFIASSPSLFPPAYVLEMQNCLDNSPPIPFKTIQKIIREELGRERVSTAFLYIDPVPMASASVAQVHRAKLANGRDVVLKVQKPGVGDVLTTDLGFIYIASRVLEIVQPRLARASFSSIVGDIRVSMLDELDFRKEAKNIEAFREFLVRTGIKDATAPEVIPELSTERVLTMERLVGVPLTDLDGIRQFSPDPEATLIAALNTWSLSVVMCETFHADVHAGNLLVLRDGRVGFLDFGIVGRVPPKIWNALRDLALAIAKEDFKAMAVALVAMGAADSAVDISAFGTDIERVYDRIRSLEPEVIVAPDGGAVQLDQEAVTRLLLDVVGVAESNGLRLPREFGLLLKQSLYFDRYNRLLAPNLDPLRDERVRLPGKDSMRDASA